MKQIKNNMLAMVICLGAIAISLSGCYETHYYHRYHHHTHDWYDHHHQAPPAGVDFRVDVRN